MVWPWFFGPPTKREEPGNSVVKLTTCTLLASLCVLLAWCDTAVSGGTPESSKVTKTESGEYLVAAPDGRLLKISPYGDSIIRLQTIRPGESFLPDNHYEMVVAHDWPGSLDIEVQQTELIFAS